MSRHILIVGAGAGGMAAATRARRLAPKAQISVVEQSSHASISVCGLPYWLAGEVARWQDLVAVSADDLRQQHNLTLLLQHRAVGVDARQKSIEVLDLKTQRTRQLDYDRLVVASGSEPNRIIGSQGDNVFTIVGLEDAQRLDRFLSDARPSSALVIGGGYLGLEMCEALRRRGLKVTLVEAADTLLGLEPDLAGSVEKELEDNGVRVLTGVTIDGLEGTLGQNPTQARSLCGQSFAADLFFLALGVSPKAGLLKEAGAKLGERGAVRVDRRAATSLDGVFACGDCVEVEHRLPGRRAYLPLATTASRLGRIAGQNVVDQTQHFSGGLGTVAVKVFGLQVAATGLTPAQAETWGIATHTVQVLSTSASGYHPQAGVSQLSLCLDRTQGRILGGQAVANSGAVGRINVVATAIEAELDWTSLEKLDLAYTPPFAALWDPLFLAARNRLRETQEKELMWEKGGSWV